MTDTDTHALLLQARAGDARATDRLLRACRPDLRRYARRHCPAEEVDDTVQDALWIVARRLGSLRAAAAWSSWLFQVVRRLCLRVLLRRGPPHEAWDDARHELGAPTQDALRLDLARSIAALPPLYRDALVLVDVAELPLAEAAAQLGIALPALKSRLHRARALARQALGG